MDCCDSSIGWAVSWRGALRDQTTSMERQMWFEAELPKVVTWILKYVAPWEHATSDNKILCVSACWACVRLWWLCCVLNRHFPVLATMASWHCRESPALGHAPSQSDGSPALQIWIIYQIIRRLTAWQILSTVVHNQKASGESRLGWLSSTCLVVQFPFLSF